MGQDTDDIITTGVDTLISFLEGKEKVLLNDAAAALSVKPEVIQSWVDFLVEEGILGIEYKFTKPYIYLNRAERGGARSSGAKEVSWDMFHQAFLQSAHGKGIPEIEAATLWKNHVLTLLERRRAYFFDEARKRGIRQIEQLWDEYKLEVLMKI